MHMPLFPDRWNWHGCSAVVFDPERLGGRATVGDSRMDADGVLLNFHGGMMPDEIVDSFGIDKGAVETILVFAAAQRFEPIED